MEHVAHIRIARFMSTLIAFTALVVVRGKDFCLRTHMHANNKKNVQIWSIHTFAPIVNVHKHQQVSISYVVLRLQCAQIVVFQLFFVLFSFDQMRNINVMPKLIALF